MLLGNHGGRGGRAAFPTRPCPGPCHALLRTRKLVVPNVRGRKPGPSQTEEEEMALLRETNCFSGQQAGSLDSLPYACFWKEGRGGSVLLTTSPRPAWGSPWLLPHVDPVASGVPLSCGPNCPSALRTSQGPSPPFWVEQSLLMRSVLSAIARHGTNQAFLRKQGLELGRPLG